LQAYIVTSSQTAQKERAMTDAYIFEVHTDDDVFEVNGRKLVVAKYVFDPMNLEAVPNTDVNLTHPVISRHKDGRVFAYLLRMAKAEFLESKFPVDCYIESAFQCKSRTAATNQHQQGVNP
jgi:hypothetical protein